MGTVWAAENTVTGRTVALKCMPLSGKRATSRARFLREARAAALLEHPNVVEVLDAFSNDDFWVIVMTLLHGETLLAHLDRTGPLSIENTATLLLPVVSALGAAHAHGLIHRDIKPENVFLLSDGGVKVVDFGIAKFKAAGPAPQSSRAVGTPAYMSPEQALRDCEIDCRSDVWSLGLVLYQCLLGRQPIIADNAAQMATTLKMSGLPGIESNVSSVPAPVKELLTAMLRLRRDERLEDLNRAYDVLAAYSPVRPPRFGPPHASVVARDTQMLAPVPARSVGVGDTVPLAPRPRAAQNDAPDAERPASIPPQAIPLATAARLPWRRTALAAAALCLLSAAIVFALTRRQKPAGSPVAAALAEPESAQVDARKGPPVVPLEPVPSAELQTEAPNSSPSASNAGQPASVPARARRRQQLPLEENPYLFK